MTDAAMTRIGFRFRIAASALCLFALCVSTCCACDCDLANSSVIPTGRFRTEFELCWLLQRYNLGHLDVDANTSISLQPANMKQMFADLRLLTVENGLNKSTNASVNATACRKPIVPAYDSNQLLLYYFAWLLYQIVTRSCTVDELQDMVLTLNQTQSDVSNSAACNGIFCDTSLLLWANLAGLIIGGAGFLAVLVVRWIADAPWFQILQQFLIAAAISTLSGDALLHLIPHAMMKHSHSSEEARQYQIFNMTQETYVAEDEHEHEHEEHDSSDHTEEVWRGIAGLCGIFTFIMISRIAELIRSVRVQNKHKRRASDSTLVRVDWKNNDEIEVSTAFSSPGGEPVPSLRDTPKKQTLPPSQRISTTSDQSSSSLLASRAQKMETMNEDDDMDETRQMNMNMNMNTNVNSEQQHGRSHNHSHSHSHGHSHGPDDRIENVNDTKTLIGTVVIGDAMHNFCDGLVIGVGFASGKFGGLSTAIAVFCHELPHELGDFAFLLHCGMRMRNALLCNAASAVVCLVGLWAGLLLDQAFASLSTYVFMFTAGMFLYIALSAMVPELSLSAASQRESSKSNGAISKVALRFSAQLGGLLFGAAVMICIALYEDQLTAALRSGEEV